VINAIIAIISQFRWAEFIASRPRLAFTSPNPDPVPQSEFSGYLVWFRVARATWKRRYQIGHKLIRDEEEDEHKDFSLNLFCPSSVAVSEFVAFVCHQNLRATARLCEPKKLFPSPHPHPPCQPTCSIGDAVKRPTV
jgi:hypothetical protein